MTYQIRSITSTTEFDQLTEDWRTLQVYTFGPLADLDDDEDGEIQVMIVEVDGQAVAYLIADGGDLWHIETRPGYGGNGYAKALAKAAQISYAYEVCADSGAAFCEALGIEFDDCRE